MFLISETSPFALYWSVSQQLVNESNSTIGDYIAPINNLYPNFTKISVTTSESFNIHKNGEDLIVYF